MARFFTSDTHWGDDRFNLFYRPFKTVQEQEDYLVEKWNSVVGPDDEVFHVGDFATTDEGLEVVKRLNGKIHLIMGNYDDPRPKEKLEELFESVWEDFYDNGRGGLELSNGESVHLNHYPDRADPYQFNIVGHIHGLWKVQRNMINVSTDAWHFTPVSEDQIVFAMTAIRKYYDGNVFAGELEQNIDNIIGNEIYAEEDIPALGTKVFLAGPTPRSLDVESWRPAIVKMLRESGYKGDILLPEKRNIEEGYDYVTQVAWESDALDASDLIIFWVRRNLETMPGFTTNIEFGEWMRSGKIVLGFPLDADKMRYMQMKAEKHDIETFEQMKPLAEYVAEILEK